MHILNTTLIPTIEVILNPDNFLDECYESEVFIKFQYTVRITLKFSFLFKIF